MVIPCLSNHLRQLRVCCSSSLALRMPPLSTGKLGLHKCTSVQSMVAESILKG